MRSDFIRRTASDAYDELGIHLVSVFLALDDPIEAVCGGVPYLVRYGKVRLSSVGRLRGAGFPLIPTLARPHYDIVLPDIADETLSRLEGCFDPPIPNPGRA